MHHVLGQRVCLRSNVDNCRYLHHYFPGSIVSNLAQDECRCHQFVVIRESCHACRSTHVAWSIAGDFAICGSPRPSSFVECITQYWGKLVKQESLPRYSSWSVSSSSSVQQPSSLVFSPSGASCSRSLTHPSLGHNLAGCPMPPHT